MTKRWGSWWLAHLCTTTIVKINISLFLWCWKGNVWALNCENFFDTHHLPVCIDGVFFPLSICYHHHTLICKKDAWQFSFISQQPLLSISEMFDKKWGFSNLEHHSIRERGPVYFVGMHTTTETISPVPAAAVFFAYLMRAAPPPSEFVGTLFPVRGQM